MRTRTKNRHRSSRWKFLAPGGAAAVTLALLWSAMGMPGWADEAAKSPSPQASAAPVGAVACDDGKDGDGKGRFQAVYVTRSGETPRADGPASVRHILWDIDQNFEASAKRYAGYDASARPRFVQDENCRPKVMHVEVDGLGEKHAMSDAREAARKEVEAKTGAKWWDTHRTLYFYDTGKPDGCGTGGMPNPDQRSSGSGDRWAEVSWDCAGEGAMTHEMVHSFGVSHCDEDKSQGNDPICRGYDSTPRCAGPRSGSVLDCGRDEFTYFDPRPAKGSRLATHPKENVYNSPYLMKDRPARPVAARIVAQGGEKCLAVGKDGRSVVSSACGGQGQEWTRSIGGRGFFVFKNGGKCLTRTAEGPELAACSAGSPRQHWWPSSSQGDSKTGYQFVNGSAKADDPPVKLGGAETFFLRNA